MTKLKSRRKELEALYATLPKIECQRKCQEACGPIGMTEYELNRIKALGHEPKCSGELVCSLLNGQGQCSVYEVRPAICRLWGLTPNMRCPFGCVPERWVSEAEARRFLDRVARIGGESVFIVPEVAP